MTRRPATRRPPKLAPVEPRPAIAPNREPTRRQRLLEARVSGRQRVGRTEVLTTARRVVRGEPAALYELPPFAGLVLDEVMTAIAAGWGPDLGSPDLAAAVSVDPDRTLACATAAFGRIADVARRGGRLLFATTRPASLLGLSQELVRLAQAAGGDVLADDETGLAALDARSDRRIRWCDGVAVITDGEALLGGPGFGAAAELAFHLPPPDLVIADRAIAGGSLAAGIETVALAGFDAVALGVAAHRGEPVTLVPLDDTRSPAAYGVLAGVAREAFAP
ncbi:MAG: phosphatase [Acidimicrobiia bacterium]